VSTPGLGGHLRAIHASLEPAEIVAATARAARDLVGAEQVHAFQREASGRLVAASGADAPPVFESPGGRMVEDPWLTLVQHAHGVVRLGAADLPSREPPSPFAGLRVGLGAALRVEGRLLGVLVAGAATASAFSFVEELLLGELAAHAAVALDRAERVRGLLAAEQAAVTARLAGGLAHELNEPLAVVIGTAELLRRGDVAPRVAEGLARIAAEAQGAARVLRALLLLARPAPAQRVRVDPWRLLDEAVAAAEPELRAAGVEVVRREAVGLPPVTGDPGQLRQALAGLVRQAARGCRGTAGPGRVAVAARHDAATGRVLLEVADNGAGLAPGVLPGLFEPFAIAGSRGGLDLAVARAVVAQHGGLLRAEAPAAGGLRLVVELPAGPGGPPVSPPARPGSGARVLLVEDERVVGDLLAEILAREGHQVDRAANGREALARVREGPYALIVSDVRMPDVDGPTFYRELAVTDPHLARSVVFVTGDVMSPETRRFLDETSLRYLEKPFTLAEFQAVVRSLLGQPGGAPPSRGLPTSA
jgi:signal transduction histidine kinase/ActR/RegA family two-component response regulator